MQTCLQLPRRNSICGAIAANIRRSRKQCKFAYIADITFKIQDMATTATIREISGMWKEDKRKYVKYSSFAAYALILETHILPAFGDRTEIHENDVQAFALQKLQEGLSPKSVKDMLAVLKMVIRFGEKLGYFSHEEWHIRFPLRQGCQAPDILDTVQYKTILKYVGTHVTLRNLGIYICLSTGMRIGEICGLRWDDIDTDSGMIRVRRTVERIYVPEGGRKHTELIIGPPKTRNSVRDIPMTSNLLEMVLPFKEASDGQSYVLTNSRRPTEPRTYRAYYRKLLEDLGIPHLKFHGLRHSFATRCIESNSDYKTVSVLLGHSNISTTLNLYVHPNMEQKRRCIDRMFKTLI